MSSTDRQISIQPVDFKEVNGDDALSLGSLRLAIGLLFFGMMLTLSVTLSLAGQVADPRTALNPAPIERLGPASPEAAIGPVARG